MDQLLLKPEEAALLLRVGRSKVYSLAAAGIIPTVRLGHAMRIPADALRRWVEEQSESAAITEAADGDELFRETEDN